MRTCILKVSRYIYAMGFRPSKNSPFYNYNFLKEEQWRTGKK